MECTCSGEVGAVCIRQRLDMTDREMVELITESPYLQSGWRLSLV
jgi:hypothetical protein